MKHEHEWRYGKDHHGEYYYCTWKGCKARMRIEDWKGLSDKLAIRIKELEAAGKRLFMHTNHTHSCNYTGKRGCDCGVQEARNEWQAALETEE